MWKKLAQTVLDHRIKCLVILLVASAFMTYEAAQVKLSYDFSKAIPRDNPKYLEFQEFKKMFGDDGNTVVAAVQDDQFFQTGHFTQYQQWVNAVKHVSCVEDVLSVPNCVGLKKDTIQEKLVSFALFDSTLKSQPALDSSSAAFLQLPFYRGMLYNPQSNVYLMAIQVNKDSMNSPKRSAIVAGIKEVTEAYTTKTGVEVHLSGLPLIRTVLADRIQQEMKWFLAGSLLLSVLMLLLFFRSWSTMFLSIAVVLIGVVWAMGLIQLCGYKITLLTALIPSLMVVIGIPNCIYFLNKYHTCYLHGTETDLTLRKKNALVDMVSKMGVVTLFCNITAAIGFAVFALTKSDILREFGVVSGIAILLIFVISFILLPSMLSWMPAPSSGQLRYLNNRPILATLGKMEIWAMNHSKKVLIITALFCGLAFWGMSRLKTEAYIVDDLPKSDKIYTDLKFFEKHFKGIMPLEIWIDTKKKNGLSGMKSLSVFEKTDSLSAYIQSQPSMNRPLSLAEGLKFAKQAFYDNDTAQYLMPNSFDGAFVADYLRPAKKGTKATNSLSKIQQRFIDSSRRYTRMSVNMADVGTKNLPGVLEQLQKKATEIFDTTFNVTLTGTTITFQEGSRYIINGLKESIFWAFLLIALSMLYLFRSVRILLCSLIPNLIPLLITAGIMGWVGVPLKPSTVLVFSVTLGIAIDITIRFLVNYRQEMKGEAKKRTDEVVRQTIRETGLSILYTSLVLSAGFIIFCLSSFGGTFSLGWLTSITLIISTITNLTVLPVLLTVFQRK
jgi:predicted RND superfamily exporter protein